MNFRISLLAAKTCVLGGLACTVCYGDTQRLQPAWFEPLPGVGPEDIGPIPAQPAVPLTNDDRVYIKAGHFYKGCAHDASNACKPTRIRFFGVNLALSANFPSKVDGEALAKRLAGMGVNLVRLHAIDQPSKQRDVDPTGVLVDASLPVLDQRAVKSIKRLIDQFGRHGIYVDINLHVNHTFPPSRPNDFIPSQSKPLQIFDEEMIRWQERYTESLASALDLRHTPGLAMVEIDNESTLIDNWQEGRLDTLVKGRFLDLLTLKWRQYENAHNLHHRPIPLNPRGLPPDYARDAASFFVDLDRRYIGRIASVVRMQVGDSTAVSGTQIIHGGRWKHGGFVNFDVNQAATFTDAHFYVDHYWFPGRQWDWSNWRISNSWLGDVFESTLMNLAFARAADKPFVVSEFNQPWPNQQASDLLPVVTQFAVSQDWDGLILYAYSHDHNWKSNTPSDFSLKGDWTKLAQFAQCAYYFRNLLPNTSLAKAIVSLNRNERITAATKNISGDLSGYLAAQRIVAASAPMQNQIQVADSPTVGIQSADASRSSSYLSYDERARQIRFGSAYAAGISGFIGIDSTVHSTVFDLTLLPRSRGFATAFITSLDSRPLSESKRLLLSLPGFSMGLSRAGPQQLNTTDLGGKWWTIPPDSSHAKSANLYDVNGPTEMERIPAKITLHLRNAAASVYALDMSGNRIASIDAYADGNDVTFSVNTAAQQFAAAYEIILER